MKIKFLPLVAGFLLAMAGVSSCLDSDRNYEYSTDATLHAFGLDTVLGRHYHFEIDQLKRLVYNKDSMPMQSDTILKKILIDTLTATGWVTSGDLDTVLNITDSVDLREAINSDSRRTRLRVHSADGTRKLDYYLKILVHKEDPDSLVWTRMGTDGLPAALDGTQKAVTRGNDLWMYTADGRAYATPLSGYAWKEVALEGFPANAKTASIVNLKDTLYITDEAGAVSYSADGIRWSLHKGMANAQVYTLLATYSDHLAGIVTGADGIRYFCATRGEGLKRTWDGTDQLDGLQEVPADFPTEQTSYTRFKTSNGVEEALLVGMKDGGAAGLRATNNDHTVPWASMDGKTWVDYSVSSDAYCPAIDGPFIMHYGDGNYYIFGGDFKAIYASANGLAWHKTLRKFLPAQEFGQKAGIPYSITTDANHNIWIVWGGKGRATEVWRGCLNRLKPQTSGAQ